MKEQQGQEQGQRQLRKQGHFVGEEKGQRWNQCQPTGSAKGYSISEPKNLKGRKRMAYIDGKAISLRVDRDVRTDSRPTELTSNSS